MATIQMNKLLNVYKPIGITPYQLIQQVKEHFPEYKDEPIGFAGRLDPLAHGVMLLMVGEATKEREQYLNLPKTYEFEALFGIETDTYDLLGMIKSPHPPLTKGGVASSYPSFSKGGVPQDGGFLHKFIKSKLGKQIQPYPPFSSKTVQGKPLFWWAKSNKLSEIKIPERAIEIFDFTLVQQDTLTLEELQHLVNKSLARVEGDFRQHDIRTAWTHLFLKPPVNTFQTASFTLTCSSGTYVRGLVHELGRMLGAGAVTIEILRTSVGNYALKDSLKLDKQA